jgi:two-component system OmpR family response regulator
MEPLGPKVIVLDDEPLVGELIAAVLKTRGYPVLVADGCADAARFVREHNGAPALLITDVIMPEMTGPQFVQRLRDEGMRLPVLYISGHVETDPAQAHEVYDGANFLMKPFSAAELIAAVDDALRGSNRD